MRQEADEITEGADTKSEKVRRLAKHGYNRTEIADLLGIRYQHVRKVLLDSGFNGGLVRGTKSDPAVSVGRGKAADKPVRATRAPINGKVLIDAGFRVLGDWVANEDGTLVLGARAPNGYGVYAILLNDVIVYIGVSSRLDRRMYNYAYGAEGQKTSARIKGLIGEAIAAEQRVTVLIATPGNSEWNGLPVSLSPGLEVGLIELIQPQWNMRGLGSK